MDAQQTDPGRMITCVTQLDLCLLFPGGFPHSSVGKESACSVGDPSLIPGSGRSPGEGNGYPLQYSGLENSMDSTVHGVTKSRTRLSDFQVHLFSVCVFTRVHTHTCI